MGEAAVSPIASENRDTSAAPPTARGFRLRSRLTELADYRAAKQLFDLFVRATEVKKIQQTLAAGVEETITRTSNNGAVECTLFRQDVNGQFPREDAYCTFHGLSGANITKVCL